MMFGKLDKKKIIGGVVLVFFLALAFIIGTFLVKRSQPVQERQPVQEKTTNSLPPVKDVFVILMESFGWTAIHNSPSAPYINSILSKASYATQYYPPDKINHSLPQYIWLEAGDNLGVTDNRDPSVYAQATTDHLVTLLNNAGISWKAYAEDISGKDCPVVDNNNYAVRHVPFVYFTDVTSNPSYCVSHVRPFNELTADLKNNSVARYNFITPNVCDDMHTSCASGDQIAQGDSWLKSVLPQIMNSQAYQNGGVIFITWDNDDTSMDNPIPMIVLSPLAKGGGYNNAIHYDHGSLLRTLQEIFRVFPFMRNAATVNDLSDLFINPETPAPSAH